MNKATANTALPFLAGGGEMGELTRNYDWCASQLGNPDSWPLSLKTIVNILLNSRFPMFLWWGDDLIQFYNDAYRPSFGKTGKHPQALGQKGVDCWPEIWPIIKPLIDHVLSGAGAYWSEDQLIPIYRNDQMEDVYWTFGYSPVNNDEGKITGVLVICNETTQKVKNFEALKESEQQLRFAIEAAELATWDLNPLTNRFTANSRLKEWFGINPEDEIELTVALNIIIESDRRRVINAIQTALEYSSGGLYDIEYTIVNPLTREARVVQAKGKATFNDDKKAIRFNGTLHDITKESIAHKKAEEAEERAKLAVDASGLGHYEINLVSDDMKTSDRFNSIWGVSKSISRTEFASRIHPDDWPAREAAHKESIASGMINYEARVIWDDRSIHWVRVRGKVFYDEGGAPLNLLGVIQDITEQKNLERHKDEFVSLVSHELKTPLTSLYGFSQLLGERAVEMKDDQLKMMTTRMTNQAKRLNYIVQDLLDAARIEGNKIRFRDEPFEFNELVSQIAEEVRVIAPNRSIRIETSKPTEVFADRERISQVIMNLLINAIKYSPSHSEVHVSIYRQHDEIVCSVSDKGIGVAKEDQVRIFEQFYQVSEEGRSNLGLGLGLYISTQIILRQNGRIWLESEQNKGSTFYFSLPVSRSA